MLWLLFGQRMGTQMAAGTVNLIPLRTIEGYMRELASPFYRRAVINIFGNILTFVPLGFFMPLLWEKLRKLFPFILAALTVIVAIELIQLVTALGCCDVDDLLLNLPGMLFGYLVWRVISAWTKNGK